MRPGGRTGRRRRTGYAVCLTAGRKIGITGRFAKKKLRLVLGNAKGSIEAREAEMSHTDYRTLIDRGRKAGLRTSELYSALAARQPAVTDLGSGQADGNGFTASY